MVLIQPKSNRLITNGSFGEIINEFQDRNIEKNIRTLERKKKIYVYMYSWVVCVCLYM